MSIYYECRFKDIKLNLKDRPDILEWLHEVSEFHKLYRAKPVDTWLSLKDTDDDIIELNSITSKIKLPKELIGYDRIEYLSNSFTDNLNSEFIFEDSSIVTIDVCIGNKNNDSDIERLIWLLKPYIIAGEIYYYNEVTTRQVNIDKSFKDGWKKDIFYDTLEFYPVKDSMKFLGLTMDDSEIDYLYNELFNGLE